MAIATNLSTIPTTTRPVTDARPTSLRKPPGHNPPNTATLVHALARLALLAGALGLMTLLPR